MNAQEMGSFIALRRKELGLTQAELAQRLFVTDKAISKWERGAGLPDIHTIEPLAQALEVSLVELVQARCVQQENISLREAEQIVVDTIQLSKGGKASKVIGGVILSVFGAACVFLLGLLISEGSIVMDSVGSLVTGLIAWGAPVWQLTLAKTKNTAGPAMVSLGAALISLTIQFFQLAQVDFATIEDTIHVLCIVVVFFGTVTFLLNLLMFWRMRKQ